MPQVCDASGAPGLAGATPLRKAGDDGENYVGAQVTRIHAQDKPGTQDSCDCFQRDHLAIPSLVRPRLGSDCFGSASSEAANGFVHRGVISISLISLQLASPPMRLFPLGIELWHVVPVQSPHNADPREHRCTAAFRHQDQRCRRRLPPKRGAGESQIINPLGCGWRANYCASWVWTTAADSHRRGLLKGTVVVGFHS